MSNEVIQADYDALEQIAAQFGNEAAAYAEMRGRVGNVVDGLRGGGWEGEGSEAFFKEMDSMIFPAVERLMQAMTEAQSATLLIKKTIRAAEEEASSGWDASTGSVPLGGSVGVSGGGLGAAGGQNGSLAGGAFSGGSGAGFAGSGTGNAGTGMGFGAPIRPQEPDSLVVSDPANQFTEAYMDSKIGSRYQGGNTRRLAMAMRSLAANPDDPAAVDAALTQIAEARGRPVSEIRAEYERYQTLRDEALAAAARNPKLDPPPDLQEWVHTDPITGGFMGTHDQLRYGEVVGDTFGIDPVFGAMLNPTGGLVGPGNYALPMGESVLGYHGTFHDAAGYLYNYHGIGPGYDYLGRESNRDTGSPLTGQLSGIAHWTDKLYVEPIRDFGRDVKDTLEGAADRVSDWWGDLWN